MTRSATPGECFPGPFPNSRSFQGPRPTPPPGGEREHSRVGFGGNERGWGTSMRPEHGLCRGEMLKRMLKKGTEVKATKGLLGT